MKEITLYEFESPNIKVSMRLYFNDKNELVFDGYDIGKNVEELMGDSDYEYQYKICFEEAKKLAKLFKTDINKKSELLKEIKNRFNEYDAYSKFGDFMNKNNIEFESFTWR